MLVLGMGEELWSRFVPKYLEALGAGVWIIAAFGTLRDLLDAVYQYPGGWLSDRLGPRSALIVFALLATTGYSFYYFTNTWPLFLAGTLLAMAWSSLTLPAIFSVIADNLPQNRRAIGFGVQSILKRIPIIVAPVAGGWLMSRAGLMTGMKIGFLVTIAFAIAGAAILFLFYRERRAAVADSVRVSDVWRGMTPGLKRLLVADCLARLAEGIPEVFIVLYVMNLLHTDALHFGSLTSLQMLTSVLVYMPVAKLSDQMNRKPVVLLTFCFFALFPLALVGAQNSWMLTAAFVVAGLREIGEPARKSLIADLVPASVRARTVGLYYLIRGMVVFPASLAGGALWKVNVKLPFYTAFVAGVIGCIWYALRGENADGMEVKNEMGHS